MSREEKAWLATTPRLFQSYKKSQISKILKSNLNMYEKYDKDYFNLKLWGEQTMVLQIKY